MNLMKLCFTEAIGTFFLVIVICLTGNPVAIGAILMVMVYMGGPISGAHYNPAVTIGIWITEKTELSKVLFYIISQSFGASMAILCYSIVANKEFIVMPDPGFHIIKPLLIEMIFTFALVLVIINVAVSKKTAGNSYFGVAIGFTIGAAAFAGGPISGGVYNPSIAIGMWLIQIVSGNSVELLTNSWIYFAGPFLGAAIAGFYNNMINANNPSW